MRPCVVCEASAVCLGSGYIQACADVFREKFPDAYTFASGTPRSAAHLRAAVQQAAAQARQAFPVYCPEEVRSTAYWIEEIEGDRMVISINRDHLFEVTLL